MIVYEDGAVVVRAVERGAVVGHVTVQPRRDVAYLSELSADVRSHLFFVASYVSTAVFEGLGAQGTNVLCVEGGGPLTIHVLPRSQDDGLDLFWEPERADPSALSQVASRVKDELWYVGRKKPKEQVASEAEASEPEVVEADPDHDYRLRNLRRSP